MVRGRERDDWNASMFVGAEMDNRRDSAKAFLLKDGILKIGLVLPGTINPYCELVSCWKLE